MNATSPNPTPTDPTLGLRDIRPAIEIPEPTGWPLWATVLLISIALAAAALIWWRWRRRPAAPAVDPASLALAELDDAHRQLEHVDADAYAMAISEVLRRFIERRYGVAAVRQTSEEFLLGLSRGGAGQLGTIDQTQRSVLRDFLNQCDLVKFARGQLDHRQREQLHDVARSFIQTSAERPVGAVASASAPPAIHPLESTQGA